MKEVTANQTRVGNVLIGLAVGVPFSCLVMWLYFHYQTHIEQFGEKWGPQEQLGHTPAESQRTKGQPARAVALPKRPNIEYPRYQPLLPGKPASLYVALDTQTGVLCKTWPWLDKDLGSTASLRDMKDQPLCPLLGDGATDHGDMNYARYQPLLPDSPMTLNVAFDTDTGTLCRTWEWHAEGPDERDIVHKLQFIPLCYAK